VKIRLLLPLFAAYALLDFLLIPNNRPILFPVSADDYRNLSSTLASLPKFPVRPVSTAAISVAAQLGQGFFYILLQVLTLLYAALALAFVGRLLRWRGTPLVAFLFGACLFGFPESLDWMKYTGLITNLLAGIFGTLAMLLLLRASERENRAVELGGALALFAFSVFSKEDFGLPFLVLALFLLVESPVGRRRVSAVLGGGIVIAAASLAYNNFAADSSFTQLTSVGAHAVVLSPGSVLRLLWRYAASTPYLAGVSALFCLAVLLGMASLPERRRPVLLCLAVGLSVIAPYTVLPNHFFRYYAFAPVAWELATLAVLGGIFCERLSPGRRNLAAAAALVAVALCATVTAPARHAIVEKYADLAARNRKMVNVVLANRSRIEEARDVGVLGLTGRTPWTNNRGEYFERKLGLKNRWLVFVPQTSMFFKIGWGEKEEVGSRIVVRPLSEVLAAGRIPFLEFDPAGNGRLVP
jgi:hypothetical protein